MFGGTVLSRNQEWVDASIAFAIDGFNGAQKIKKYPEWFKPVAKYFIPEIRKIHKHYEAAEKAAIPLLKQRERDQEKALDLLYWMAEQAKGGEKDLQFIAGILLKVSFAAIHTSAAAPSQLIYDLCAMPEYVEPLRNEMEENLAQDGTVKKTAFVKLTKLDSIMKESQRHNPLLLSKCSPDARIVNPKKKTKNALLTVLRPVTFERVVTEDYSLSDGFVIPANTTIGLPTQAISMDPTLYPNPNQFDAFRFSTLREINPDKAGKAQYVASNPESMSFGFGRHACPGRFFAANEIKAIMVYLLMNYDMRFLPGQARPRSLQFETQYLPSHDAGVLFKRRGRKG